jgi:pimeloyl-ACP methyl ester carboxylesterase
MTAAFPRGGVVLLHGHGRSGRSMRALGEACEAVGLATLAPDYGMREAMDAIVARIAPRVAAFAAGLDGPVHVITHSLGGLVARVLLTAQRPAALGRVVMIAPPNAGSPLAEMLYEYGLGELVLGPVGGFLRTARDGHVQARLGAVDFELGVIAGDRAYDLVIPAGLMPLPHDGKVPVAATRVDGMRDHIVLPVAHTFMIRDPRVVAQALAFIQTGAFARSCDNAAPAQ